MGISKTEIAALKGLCITMIIIHNVVHLLTPVHENEFQFNPDHVTGLFTWFETQPVANFFSFWGWLGVSLFLFASGYGLSVKYDSRSLNTGQWIKRHYLKLQLLLLPAHVAYLAMMLVCNPHAVDGINVLLEQLFLLNVLAPATISPGIFWYIGTAFQFYLWYLWFRKLNNVQLILIAVCSCLAVALLPTEYVSYIRHNSIGWMPEFIFGMLLARSNRDLLICHSRAITIGIACLGVILLAFSKYTFMLSGACFVYLLLAYRKRLSRMQLLLYAGNVSASLYVVHAVIRQIVSVSLAVSRHDLNMSATGTSIIVLIMSLACAIPYQALYANVCQKWLH